MTSDLRRFPRLEVRQNMKYRLKGETELHGGQIQNMSGGGMCVSTRKPLKSGDEISLEFRLPGNVGAVIVSAVVAWSTPSKNGLMTPHLAGIEFLKVPEHSREEIVEYVNRRLKAIRAGKSDKVELLYSDPDAPRIMVVDDDVEILDLLKMVLCDEYNVIAASDSRAAVEAARERKPDLIFLDLKMPGMDGFQTLLMLKEDEETKPIPVVMLTSVKSRIDVVNAFQKGASGFITKPFEERVLLDKVKEVLAVGKA